MKESVLTALGWIKSNFYRLNINKMLLRQYADNNNIM